MSTVPEVLTSTTPTRETFAWCPICGGPRPCEQQQGTTDWQTTPVYTCRVCNHVTHDPIIRLALPEIPAPSFAAK